MSKIRRGLLWLLTLALVREPLVRLLQTVLPSAAVEPIPWCLAGILQTGVLLGLPAWRLRPWTSDRLCRQKNVSRSVLEAAAVALLTRFAMTPVDQCWQRLLKLEATELPIPQEVPVALACLLALVVLPALIEEVFFRGALLTSLLDGCRRETAILLTTLAFVLMHGNAANMPSLTVFSLGMTLIMLRHGHAAAPMAAHLLYNLTALGWQTSAAWISICCGLLLAVMLATLCVKQPRYAHQPMKGLDGLIAAACMLLLAVTYIV